MSCVKVNQSIIHLHDSLEHVLNVGAHGPDGSNLLRLAKPFLNLDGVFVHLEKDLKKFNVVLSNGIIFI